MYELGQKDALGKLGFRLSAPLQKTATVRGPVKQYRRALQLLQGKDHAFHTGDVSEILSSGVMKPGKANALSPMGATVEGLPFKDLPQ